MQYKSKNDSAKKKRREDFLKKIPENLSWEQIYQKLNIDKSHEENDNQITNIKQVIHRIFFVDWPRPSCNIPCAAPSLCSLIDDRNLQ